MPQQSSGAQQCRNRAVVRNNAATEKWCATMPQQSSVAQHYRNRAVLRNNAATEKWCATIAIGSRGWVGRAPVYACACACALLWAEQLAYAHLAYAYLASAYLAYS